MKLERPKWPENKKCSAMITINLNAELFWLQLDPTCKDMPKTLSLGQYGMTRGVDRILKILEERGIRATFFTPGWVAEQYPDKLKAIVEKGHEIAALGYHHEHMALLSEEEQESAIKKGIAAIEKVCGVTPKGFRSPEGELTLDTLRIAKKNGTAITSATIAFVKVAANFVTIASAAASGADPTKISFTNEYPKYRTQ